MSSQTARIKFGKAPRQARQEALRRALEARDIVRGRRRQIAGTSSWIVVQTDWEEKLEAERENWREAIWLMNRNS